MKNSFTEAIKIEEKRIQRLIDLSEVPGGDHGSLQLQKRGGRIYVYQRWQRKNEPERKVYLGKMDSEQVRKLFTIKFQEQRLARLRSNQALLQRLLEEYQPYDFESVVNDLPGAYRMVAGENSFDQRYEEVRAWANADYPQNTYPFSGPENIAVDGTRLRSKGECLFYNLLQGRGILFRNDCELVIVDQLGNTKTLYPDFLIQCLDGTFIIIEHLGRMGDMGYAMGLGERSYWFFQEGFILGKNYFVTSDDPDHGTDSQMIARVVDQVEQMFFGY